MNFQYITTVENAKNIIDISFRGAKESANRARNKYRKSKNRDYYIDLARIDAVRGIITRRLAKIHDTFPKVRELPKFYQELLKICIDIDKFKKSLAALAWAHKRINSLHKEMIKRVQRENKESEKHRKAFYGRVSSIIKQINNNLVFLEKSRKKMKDFPDIKDMPTVAIAGFPNVGKSSLLKILTTATPEIASYAFTTKKLNIGYMKTDKGDIQLIDAPGSLNRKNMNWIEKQAHLAIEHLADRVIFMIDPTGISGYTINKQLELYKSIKSKIHSVAISKMDLIEETLLEKILSELKKTIKKKIIPYSATTFTNIEDIKSAIQYA